MLLLLEQVTALCPVCMMVSFMYCVLSLNVKFMFLWYGVWNVYGSPVAPCCWNAEN